MCGKISRLSGCEERINSDFVEQRTPERAMKLGLQLQLAKLLLLNTVSIVKELSAEQPRKDTHDWV
jgi:putative transposase